MTIRFSKGEATPSEFIDIFATNVLINAKVPVMSEQVAAEVPEETDEGPSPVLDKAKVERMTKTRPSRMDGESPMKKKTRSIVQISNTTL